MSLTNKRAGEFHGKIDLSFINFNPFHLLRWVCQAKNVIKGDDQILQSEPVIVEVSGRPQILIQGSDESPWYPRDMMATLNVSYCSDPRPRNLQWKWDNLALPEGKTGYFLSTFLKAS